MRLDAAMTLLQAIADRIATFFDLVGALVLLIAQGAWSRVQEEPVATATFVGAGVTLATAFGLTLTNEQQAAISTFTLLLLGWLARKAVTPNVKLEPPLVPHG